MDTNTAHLHQETKILPVASHLKLHSSQLRQQAQHPNHTLHALTLSPPTPRLKKQTVFNNEGYTANLDSAPEDTTTENIKQNLKVIHTQIVDSHTRDLPRNKVLNQPAPPINSSETDLDHSTRRTMAQLRANKSPLLLSYLNKISPDAHPTPNCPLCGHQNHDTQHLFNCPAVPTTLTPEDLWRNPEGAGRLVAEWRGALGRPPEQA